MTKFYVSPYSKHCYLVQIMAVVLNKTEFTRKTGEDIGYEHVFFLHRVSKKKYFSFSSGVEQGKEFIKKSVTIYTPRAILKSHARFSFKSREISLCLSVFISINFCK